MLEASSLGRDVIDYHNGINFIAIRGELVGHHRARRLTRIVINDAPLPSGREDEEHCPGVRKRECAALDAADINFLLVKGVFNLPPKPIWYARLTVYEL